MSTLSNIGVTIGCICVVISLLSVLIPQKRTGRLMSMVIGVFFIGSLLGAIITGIQSAEDFNIDGYDITVPDHDEQEYRDIVAQTTADHLTQALNELLLNEGIEVQDIRLTLKISDEGRIYASRTVIYISKEYEPRVGDIKSIIYRNISKEPDIYVDGEKAA